MSKRKQASPPGVEADAPAMPPPPPGPESHRLRDTLIALGLLAGLTLMMFADVLFASGSMTLSNGTTDLFLEYCHWRAFGFEELKHGNLALWNPYLFCGAPFLGGSQAALLYPPNVLFLVLPLHHAINWSIALHVFLAGAFTYGWTIHRGLRPAAGFLAAAIYMFCGANFLHIYSGYLSFLCGFVWAPLLFLAIDGLFEKPGLSWSLLGMFAAAMQVLAGNPQSLFYTAVAAGIYCAFCLVRVRDRARFVLGLAGIVFGGVVLSAVQLFAGVDEWREMLRNSGVPFQFAAMFSFSPENVLTLLAPHFFGDIKTVSYWGRCYLWEMSLFVGVSGLVLAVIGALWGGSRARRFSLPMIGLLFLLALGAHTPLFHLLYDWVPGFNKFRGNSKFIFLASLFVALLAGLGFDQLTRGRRVPPYFAVALAIMGFLLLAFGWVAGSAPSFTAVPGPWQSVMLAVTKTGETYLPPEACHKIEFVLGSARMACHGLMIGGATLALVAVLLWRLQTWRCAPHLLLALAVAELFVFARLSLDHFDLREAVNPGIKTFLEKHPGDFRIANLDYPNTALSLRVQDVWGYEPGIVLRFAQLVAFARGLPADQAVLLTTLPDAFTGDSPLLGLLRCRFAFAEKDGGVAVSERTNYLPHLVLVQNVRVLKERDQILSTVADAAFDPRKEVILESPPEPAPVASAPAGNVTLMDFSTDHLTIEAELPAPAVLLIPDVYAKGWRAMPLPGSSQKVYQVQPADWCLRAIALGAGHHRLRVEYLPLGFRAGRWITLLSVPIFILLAVQCLRSHLRERTSAVGMTSPENLHAAEDRFPIAVAVAVATAALLMLWPMVGRSFLEYGDAFAPVLGLLLAFAWSAKVLAGHWRQEPLRLSALGVVAFVLILTVVYRQVGHARPLASSATVAAGSLSWPATNANQTVAAPPKAGGVDAAIERFQATLRTQPSAPVHQSLAMALLQKGRSAEAVAHLKEAIHLDPRFAGAHAALGSLALQSGNPTEAIGNFEAALSIEPGNAYYLNNLAWMLATCPEPKIRDGRRALQLAEQASQITKGMNPAILETLAAAQAETGGFSEATATAERALDAARSQTNVPLAKALSQELSRYRAGAPFRETYSTNASPSAP